MGSDRAMKGLNDTNAQCFHPKGYKKWQRKKEGEREVRKKREKGRKNE